MRRGIAGPGFFAFSERYLDCTSFVFEARHLAFAPRLRDKVQIFGGAGLRTARHVLHLHRDPALRQGHTSLHGEVIPPRQM